MPDRAHEIAERYAIAPEHVELLADEIRGLLTEVATEIDDPGRLIRPAEIPGLLSIKETSYHRHLRRRPDHPQRYNLARAWNGDRPVWRYRLADVIDWRERLLAECGAEGLTPEESERMRAMSSCRTVPAQPARDGQSPAAVPTARDSESTNQDAAPARPSRAREPRPPGGRYGALLGTAGGGRC